MGNALGSIWALYGFYMGSIKTHTILVAELSQRAFEALPGRARASGNGRGSRSRVRFAGEVGGSRRIEVTSVNATPSALKTGGARASCGGRRGADPVAWVRFECPRRAGLMASVGESTSRVLLGSA